MDAASTAVGVATRAVIVVVAVVATADNVVVAAAAGCRLDRHRGFHEFVHVAAATTAGLHSSSLLKQWTLTVFQGHKGHLLFQTRQVWRKFRAMITRAKKRHNRFCGIGRNEVK